MMCKPAVLSSDFGKGISESETQMLLLGLIGPDFRQGRPFLERICSKQRCGKVRTDAELHWSAEAQLVRALRAFNLNI